MDTGRMRNGVDDKNYSVLPDRVDFGQVCIK